MESTQRSKPDKLVEEIFVSGYAVIPGLISPETCDKLKEWLDSRFNTDLPYNYTPGHYQIHLPRSATDFPEEFVMNETLHSVVKEILGKNYYLYSYTCNANLADVDQPYHMDCSHLHSLKTIKKFGSPGPPHQIICNLYLQDTDESNGSLDMVPKSHLEMDFEIDEEGRIDEKWVKNPSRCNFTKGSVVIRDKRTWHRGTRNSSGNVRYMVGCSYSSHWQKLGSLTFEPDCEQFFYSAPFSTHNLLYQ